MTQHARFTAGGQDLSVEFRLIEGRASRPLVVFLHEGLGSVSMWKRFPDKVCAASATGGLVFSRPGYGASTPRPPATRWPPDFMHRQARDVLPAFFAAIGLDTRADPPFLFGHSDGGSIALIHAASFPDRVAGVVALAPHIVVEDVTVESIATTRETYLSTDLRTRLARFHGDVDSAFWGWNDIWLDPAFRDWSIEALLPKIRCPVLAIQGVDDEYGTMAQIDGIAAALPKTRLVKLEGCGHSPHRDQPDAVIDATREFIEAYRHPQHSPLQETT